GGMEEGGGDGLVSQDSLRQAYVSEAELAAGHEEEASVAAERAAALAVEHREEGFRVEALRALAHVTARRSRPDVEAAARHLEEAITLAERLGMRPAAAHCHRDLAELRGQPAAQHPEAARALYRG